MAGNRIMHVQEFPAAPFRELGIAAVSRLMLAVDPGDPDSNLPT
jgi:hypothetical protein